MLRPLLSCLRVRFALSCVCLIYCSVTTTSSRAQDDEAAAEVAGNEQVAEFMQQFAPRGVMSDGSQPTPAEQAVKQFDMRPGFEIELVAAEPIISQPLFLSWDSRGRMWTVQYRQYQFPAGLKVIRYDQHLRAVFDRTPEPPPHGVQGKDVITVSEDLDGDGRYDSHRDVISGLNIATSVQVGHGGIWVLNPPYLLFYPDADRDDVPDDDPEVHLSGFGLQDTHSVANSLLWGPDGWLYGANGSTTGGTISSAVTKGVEFQGQCIWRYDPDTKAFEIYAEGGGNTFSLDIDATGQVLSGTNGGGTRGFHYPQGSYSSKNWGKHGPLTNPYAFGYFDSMPSQGDDRRFPQAFLVYDGGLFPAEEFAGDILAPNAMHNLIWHSRRLRHGSTFRTEDQQNLLETPDRWFRPVYCGVGPDGAVYVADWYDTRLSHVSPLDDWHKKSGRVYRVFPEAMQPAYQIGDLHERPAQELIELFSHPNKWVRWRAVLELGWRGDASQLDHLVELVNSQQSLEALWTIDRLGELTNARAAQWLESPSPHLRRWVVRLLGDRHVGIPEMAMRARHEPDVQVRSQLAATAKRIPAENALPIIESLLRYDQDLSDPHMPLMIWWALEAHAEAWPQVEALVSQADLWDEPLMQQEIAGRLMQRYATDGGPESLNRCVRLIELAPHEAARDVLMVGLNRAFQGRTLPELPEQLAAAMEQYQRSLGDSGLVLALRQGSPEAISQSLQLVGDVGQDLGLRIELVRALGETQSADALTSLLRLATGSATKEPALQRVALTALRNYADDKIATELLSRFGSSISAEHDLRDTASRTLATRKSWALALMQEILDWRLKPSDVPVDVVQQLRAYEDTQVREMVDRVFGKPIEISSAEKLAQMKRLQQLVSEISGDMERGKLVFAQKCGTCHKLFGEGNSIGPPLDAYERGNINFWLVSIIEPSAEIREGFQSYAALTADGRIVTGMVAAQEGGSVTIRGADNQLTYVAEEDLEELRALKTSLMPEDVLQGLSDQQIADMFAYLTFGTDRRRISTGQTQNQQP